MKKPITSVGLDVHKNSINIALADADQKMPTPSQQVLFQEYIHAIDKTTKRVERHTQQVMRRAVLPTKMADWKQQ
jgi:RNase H-fold protein (predicted Holliday junction resolvase)